MKSKWIGLSALLIVLAAPFLAWRKSSGGEQAVQAAPAFRREIKASILASGNLVYEEQAQLSPEAIGRVTSVFVKEGDQVARDQALLTIDDRIYRTDMAQREAAVRLQRVGIEQRALAVNDFARKYGRAEELFKREFVSAATIEDARYRLDNARTELRTGREQLQQSLAALTQARDQLSRTVIRAPIAGTVTALNIKAGETAVPSTIGIAGSSLMVIADTKTLIAEVNVDEADIARVRIGQDVSIFASAYPDAPFAGSVRSLSLSPRRPDSPAAGGAAPRTYSVKVSVRAPSSLVLRPGMTCRAEIFTKTPGRALSVPIQAVMTDGGEDASDQTRRNDDTDKDRDSYVFVVADGVARRRAVITGIADDEYQEILKGLRVHDKVISGPYKVLRHLTDGDEITTLDSAR